MKKVESFPEVHAKTDELNAGSLKRNIKTIVFLADARKSKVRLSSVLRIAIPFLIQVTAVMVGEEADERKLGKGDTIVLLLSGDVFYG